MLPVLTESPEIFRKKKRKTNDFLESIIKDLNEMEGNARGDDPYCYCQEMSIMKIVRKEGPNHGRLFFTCPNPRDMACGFFQWTEQPTAFNKSSSKGSSVLKNQDKDNQASAAIPICKCGSACQRFITQKEGPNQGKLFFKCWKHQCNFFAWDKFSMITSVQGKKKEPTKADQYAPLVSKDEDENESDDDDDNREEGKQVDKDSHDHSALKLTLTDEEEL